MNTRLITLVRAVDIHPPVRQFSGLPAELDPESGQVPMPWPRLLVIQEKYGDIFLDRYASDGSPAGDTWHERVEWAKEQAELEYPGLLYAWISVPTEISDDDLLAYAESNIPRDE